MDIVNNSDLVKKVKAVTYIENEEFITEEKIIAEADYINDGFELKLPHVPSSDLLINVADDLFEEGASYHFSDKNVKGFIFDAINAYDQTNNEIGIFYLLKEIETPTDYTFYTAFWMYLDKDLSIYGEDNKVKFNVRTVVNFELKLNKGWNIVYFKNRDWYEDSENGFVTSTLITDVKPKNIRLQWNFFDYNNFVKTSARQANSFFIRDLKTKR
ncbi:MAG: hypothetical protein M9887_03430 [Chitinophagales bacterium]|nr:hypothetical protein [Chitinophagales bacterium]